MVASMVGKKRKTREHEKLTLSKGIYLNSPLLILQYHNFRLSHPSSTLMKVYYEVSSIFYIIYIIRNGLVMASTSRTSVFVNCTTHCKETFPRAIYSFICEGKVSLFNSNIKHITIKCIFIVVKFVGCASSV